MQKPVDFFNETIEQIVDGDRLETVARHLRDALANALMQIAWPTSPDVPIWREQAAASRQAAADMAATVQRPRRLSGIHPANLYSQALGMIRNEYQIAATNAPRSAQARLPLALPPACSLKLAQLLEADDLAMTLLLA
jgi:hypothetical protein